MHAFRALLLIFLSYSVTEAFNENQCSLIFDFDGVIKTGEMSQSAEVVSIMKHAESAGYAVGLATMSCEETFIRGFLTERISSTTFTKEMLDSEAAQFCEASKTIEMNRIIQHYDSDPNCAVLYDDSIGNKNPVEDAGFIYIHTIASEGITYSHYNKGLEKLSQRGCYCYSFTL